MLNDQWFHACSRRIRENGFDALMSTGLAGCVSIPERNAFLQPSRTGDIYSLFTKVGEIVQDRYPCLTAIGDSQSGSNPPGAVPYGFVVLERRENGSLVVGVRIGPFAYPAGLSDLGSQLDALDDIAVEAREHLESLQSPLSVGKEGRILAVPPCFVETPTYTTTYNFLAEHLYHGYGERLIVISGARGIGKETNVLRALDALGISAIELTNGVGVLPAALVDRYRNLATTLAGRKDAALILRPPQGDRVLARNDSSDLLKDCLRDLSCEIPVILVSEQNNPNCDAANILKLEESSPDNTRQILKAHYPEAAVDAGMIKMKGTTPANPLYALQRLAVSPPSAHDTDSLPALSVERVITDISAEYLGNEAAVRQMVTYLVSQLHWPSGVDRASRNTVILLAGKSGIGKSLFGSSLAKALGTNLVRIPCNEEANASVMFRSRLIGGSAGYVGYGDEAKLDSVTPGEDDRFGSVILWDEVEKCSVETRNILLSHMQDGIIETSRKSFALHNNIILLTTNHAVRELDRNPMGFDAHASRPEDLKALYRKDGFFLTEFLSRIHLIVQLDAHGDETCIEAIKKELDRTVYQAGRSALRVKGSPDRIAATLYRQHRHEFDSYGIRRAEALVRQHVLAPLVPFIERGASTVHIEIEDHRLIFSERKEKRSTAEDIEEINHKHHRCSTTTQKRKEAQL